MLDLDASNTSQMETLRNKVVLLFGSDKIDGRALALSLAERGADIVVVYAGGQYRWAEEIKRQVQQKGRRCLTFPMANESKSSSQKIIRRIVDELGHLDIFIDLTALPDTINPGEDVGGNDRRSHWAQPFKNFQMIAAALKQMVEGNQRLINDNKKSDISDTRRLTMRLAQELINKPIISVKEGRELGKFRDFYLDQELGAITAVYLGQEGLLSRKESLIRWENIVTVGEDALLADEADAVLETDQESEIDDYIRRDDLVGRPIDTPGGTKIGRIGDIVIDQDAKVAGFSLSQVFVSGPIAANRIVSRSAMIDTGNEDGTMTAKLAEAEDADLKVVYEGFFAEPNITPAEEATSKA